MRRFTPLSLVLAVACSGGGDKIAAPVAVTTVSLSASATTVNVGQTATLTASPRDASGNVVTGRTVVWATSNAAIATVSAGLVTGISLGSVVITATVDTKSAQTAITITQSGPSCTGITPVSLTVGQTRVLSGAERSTLCLASGAAPAEYVLIPANLSTPRAGVSVSFISSNTQAASGPPFSVQATSQSAAQSSIAASRVSFATAGANAVASPQSIVGHLPRNLSFERALRARERDMQRGMRAARAAARAATSALRRPVGRFTPASVGTLPSTPALGTLVTLNAQANSACDSTKAIKRTARVMAVSNSAIVVEDTLAPAGGFTAAEYLSMATTFDTLIYALDTTAFGAPSDIDHNGRVVLFFTTAVNQLTTNGQNGVIGGFFFSRDLVPPLVANAEAGGPCPGSNFGEMFYLPVVDVGKQFNAFFSDKASMLVDVNGTTVHEFQHLINASRRYYVTTALVNDEETWLNEGMSHLAEELLYYKVAGLTAKSDLTFATSRTLNNRQAIMDGYQLDNMSRYNDYLLAPESNSAYADNDDLTTRGATWALLRYSLDQSANPPATYLRALVNAVTEGIPNFNTVFAGIGGFGAAMRNYVVANFTDNTDFGIAAQYTHPSWNFRDWLPHFTSNASKFPLLTRSLISGVQLQLSLPAGGASYVRFRVNSGTTAGVATLIAGAAPSSSVDLILVRTQ